MSDAPFETLIVETRGGVGLITLNRPKALNALNATMIRELGEALAAFEANEAVGAVVITGSDKAFAAGADIREMADKSFSDVYLADLGGGWRRVVECRKPRIAAVSGYALGGGAELAQMCDIVFASETAKFGQPEITLGIIPGFGGTQRLTRAVGKAKAMDLVLTGRMMDAQEAEKSGLVSRIVPAEKLLDEALEAAAKIASFSRAAVLAAKEAVDVAAEVGLSEGARFERRAFQALFATEDQTEGMAAFVEKRKPEFRNR
ncbi:enoyl-CoA hydratase [Hansschlegelia zhihuaiae]|uniref:enoyl-CoA hydratase n=1 Tax=Hansschlegelia zhihuaiae TaxID=405005 RepID=A0A4Q0MAM6_9HYPH|nr:enoyl-CoA hydratase [Hansschlegelia zhihuaiae]RXF70320.1 enoyl-CoA hydratase [Hansschlegelia zhihuaiae]